MGIFLNKKINNVEKIQYENDIKTYSGMFNDFFTQKSISIDSDTNAITFNSITYNPNNGFIIAVADNFVNNGYNFIYSSDGGETWNSGFKSSKIKSIIYANNKYVAIGYDNGVTILLTNSNSSPTTSGSWTSLNSITYSTWNSITYGNGYFIAVGDTGSVRVIVSKNATNWMAKNVPLRSWKHINYSSDLKRFIALTDSYVMYSNYNGEEWTDVSVPSGTWCSASWSSKLKLFVAVANSGTYRVMKSTNGISWSAITLSTTLTLTSVILSQELDIFVATSTEGEIITSPDGTNWTYRKGSVTNQKQIIWNSYHGNFIILSSNNNANKISINKALGIKSLLSLENYYYYEEDDFYYDNLDVLISIGNPIFLNNNLNENLKYSYSIYPSLPTGITIDTTTGELSGVPTITFSKTKFEIRANNSYKTLKTYIFLTVSGSNIPISSFYYVFLDTIIFSINSSVNLNPTIRGTLPVIYNISPSLPNLMTFDTNSGAILGTTPSSWSQIEYTITATNVLNSVVNKLTIIINDIPPSSFTYNNGVSANPFVNTAVSYYPSSNIGSNIVYSIISPSSPPLSINPTTGEIYGTTSSTPQSIVYVIKASNSNGTQFVTTSFNISVVDTAITSFYYVNSTGTDEIAVNNNAIIDITPTQTGGSNVQWNLTPSLVNGYTVSQSTGRIYGANFISNSNLNHFFRKSYQITAYNASNSINKNVIISNNMFANMVGGGFRDTSYNSPNAFRSGFNEDRFLGSLSFKIYNIYRIYQIWVDNQLGYDTGDRLLIGFKKDNGSAFTSADRQDLGQSVISITYNGVTRNYSLSSPNTAGTSWTYILYYYAPTYTLPWASNTGVVPSSPGSTHYTSSPFSATVKIIAPLT